MERPNDREVFKVFENGVRFVLTHPAGVIAAGVAVFLFMLSVAAVIAACKGQLAPYRTMYVESNNNNAYMVALVARCLDQLGPLVAFATGTPQGQDPMQARDELARLLNMAPWDMDATTFAYLDVTLDHEWLEALIADDLVQLGRLQGLIEHHHAVANPWRTVIETFLAGKLQPVLGQYQISAPYANGRTPH